MDSDNVREKLDNYFTFKDENPVDALFQDEEPVSEAPKEFDINEQEFPELKKMMPKTEVKKQKEFKKPSNLNLDFIDEFDDLSVSEQTKDKTPKRN